jgi:uncharacterized coiled-coil protein SlyX
MNTLEKIEVLEAKLTTATDSRPGTVETIQKRQAEAEAILSAFFSNPSSAQLDRAFKAHATTTAAHALLSGLGESRAWADRVQSEWTREHHAELCRLTETLINERAARRQTFRDAAGIELGRLTTAIVKADGDNAPDAELERLNDQLAEIEDSLANKEAQLSAARDALRSFKAAVARPDGYMPLYRMWRQAKDAAAAVSFETHPPHE